ncbi:HAD-IA family hydrolase [Flavobacterium sp.]|uniref:HAD family hydrolase n=1 Tax=Flavobacterium sp. TaxID=239 RepID=UPI0025DB00CA|nr:HAD-IA family hydrolase [Flavobacterium sp.]
MDSKIQYILFDVSGTLMYKPKLYTVISEVLNKYGYDVALHELKLKHKLLSEIIHFPDKTSKKFYNEFNSELLYSQGILPNESILEAIFSSCSYLPWEKFEDTKVLSQISLPMGIISNFNSSLKEKLNDFFSPIFNTILVSEEVGIAKPSIEFYTKALEKISIAPENILYIGDSIKLDMEPALKLGMKTLLIDRENYFPNYNCAIMDLKQILNYL